MMNRNEEKLVSILKERKLGAIYLSDTTNVSYISGFTADSSYIVILQNGKKYFITDNRFTEQASKECPTYELLVRDDNNTVESYINFIAKENDLSNLTFEADKMTFNIYEKISNKVKIKLVPTVGIIDKLRMIKSSEEIEYSKAACDIACRALEQLLPEIRVGVTEKELAARLSYLMVKNGSDTMPYGNIIITGPNTSLLHGIPSDRAIQYQDLILLDFGCQVNGYMSDMTRTFVVGKASNKQREIYNLLVEMMDESRKLIKKGTSARDVYLKTIDILKETEYLKYYYHNIGHGVGLALHESPYFKDAESYNLEAGNIMTIEPGIYIPDWGGIRIENQVVVTENGHESFTWFPYKELIEL